MNYVATNKYRILVDEGIIDTVYESYEDAVTDAVNFCITNFNNETDSKYKKGRSFLMDECHREGMIDRIGYPYCVINSTFDWDKSQERELVIKNCNLYMKVNDDETDDEALARLIDTLPKEIDYMFDFDNDCIEVRKI